MLAGLPKEDVAQGRGSVRNWGFAITDIYSRKANIGDRWRRKGLGSVILRFWGAGAAGEAR